MTRQLTNGEHEDRCGAASEAGVSMAHHVSLLLVLAVLDPFRVVCRLHSPADAMY